MTPPDYLEQLDAWVDGRRAQLVTVGKVVYNRSARDRPNPSAQLHVATGTNDVELLLWASGEAEFNHGPSARQVEHIDLASGEQLDVLLERFLEALHDAG